MDIRRLILTAAVLLAFASTCSEARHARNRREADDAINYEDTEQADEANDDMQNDPEGDDEADADADVKGVVMTKSESYNVTIGKTVRLACEVSPPSASIVVSWSKDNTMYSMANQLLMTNETRLSIVPNTNDLMISDVRVSDSGRYKCSIIPEEGADTYVVHNVLVQESPRIIRFTATNNGNLREGSDLLLTCDVAGSPAPTIVLSRERQNENERLREKDGEFTGNSVFIRNVKTHHSGKYYCYAINDVGSNQAEITVTVRGKPRVHVARTVVNSAINVEAILECTIHEEKPTHIRWYKDGRLVSAAGPYLITTVGTNSNLTLTPTSDQDFGNFTCEAENNYGKHSKSIELVQRPVIDDIEVDGSKIALTVHSHQSLEQVELQLQDIDGAGDWKSILVTVPESDGHVYHITYDVGQHQLAAGNYKTLIKVKNTNSWNENSEPVDLKIEAQPQYIQTASVYRDGAHSIQPTTAVFLSTVLMYLLVRML